MRVVESDEQSYNERGPRSLPRGNQQVTIQGVGNPMPNPTSLADINLAPIAGKQYFTLERESREEFIYFLMVDRFQDDAVRPVAEADDVQRHGRQQLEVV